MTRRRVSTLKIMYLLDIPLSKDVDSLCKGTLDWRGGSKYIGGIPRLLVSGYCRRRGGSNILVEFLGKTSIQLYAGGHFKRTPRPAQTTTALNAGRKKQTLTCATSNYRLLARPFLYVWLHNAFLQVPNPKRNIRSSTTRKSKSVQTSGIRHLFESSCHLPVI